MPICVVKENQGRDIIAFSVELALHTVSIEHLRTVGNVKIQDATPYHDLRPHTTTFKQFGQVRQRRLLTAQARTRC
jgi:hypothetical protein